MTANRISFSFEPRETSFSLGLAGNAVPSLSARRENLLLSRELDPDSVHFPIRPGFEPIYAVGLASCPSCGQAS